MEIVIRNNQRRIKIDPSKVKQVIKISINHLGNRYRNVLSAVSQPIPLLEVSILFVTDKKMRELNSAYRGIDKTTDVLSFPLVSDFPLTAAYVLLGDIVINPQKAEGQARENRVSFQSELSWLLIHGLLHLLGFDHEKSRYQAEKMRKIEREILEIVCP